MAVARIEIKDFFMFKGKFEASFCPGVNVLIGGNGTGKTTLLRATAIQPLLSSTYTEGIKIALTAFENTPIFRKVEFGNAGKVEVFPFEDGEYNKNKHIFIPANEMLAHPEIYPMTEQYSLSYNNSEVDIIRNAMLPVTKEITPNASKVLDKIKKEIGGEVLYRDDKFFITKISGEKVPFALEASGFRKLGLLWKLLRNGLLESGSVLFWDEPENSLNPELVPVLVDILLELSRNGVQMFIATHDYNLARYFDVRENKDIPVMFHNLSKSDNGQIKCDSSSKYIKLSHNLLESASTDLFKAVVADAMGVRNDA